MVLETLGDDGARGRIMDHELGAGFFADTWGLWPWAYGRGEPDAFVAYRVVGLRCPWGRSVVAAATCRGGTSLTDACAAEGCD